jgi:hypothetical protein
MESRCAGLSAGILTFPPLAGGLFPCPKHNIILLAKNKDKKNITDNLFILIFIIPEYLG